MSFPDFFEAATGGNSPYVYQCRRALTTIRLSFAERTAVRSCGLGKTTAVVLAWLWNRVCLPALNQQPALAAYPPAELLAGSTSPTSFSNPTPMRVAPPISPRYKRPTVRTSDHSWISGAIVLPTPKRRMLEHPNTNPIHQPTIYEH